MKIIQPSDATQQHVLPKYDFPTRMVNATPGVNRIMNYELEEVDGSSKIKIVEDDTLVFNRPKFFVGSSGTVWASEYMRLRYEEPRLFLADIDEAQPTPEVALLLDIVLNGTLASMSESETEKTGDKSETEDNVEDMFTTTRSGRVTTYWRVSKYR